MGPDQAFREFFVAQYAPLRRLGFLLTGSWDAGEELAQEALVRTWGAWRRARGQPVAYARRVLVNHHRSLLRRLMVEARHRCSAGTGRARRSASRSRRAWPAPSGDQRRPVVSSSVYAASTLDATRLRDLLAEVAAGRLPVEEAERRLARLPFEDLGYARVDHHRAVRGLGPEVVYARGKTPEQVAGIATAILAQGGAPVLATKADQDHAEAVLAACPDAEWHPRAGLLVLRRAPAGTVPGRIGVVCAGTSDLPVADEAALTAEAFGCEVDRLTDVGVSGAHRLFAEVERLQRADVLVVVAGMEGALPSLVGGLVGVPVLAVPTSVGYGAAFEGLAALLAMLNSCAVGVGVVNIDNGFGAGALAVRILAAARRVEAPAAG